MSEPDPTQSVESYVRAAWKDAQQRSAIGARQAVTGDLHVTIDDEMFGTLFEMVASLGEDSIVDEVAGQLGPEASQRTASRAFHHPVMWDISMPS